MRQMLYIQLLGTFSIRRGQLYVLTVNSPRIQELLVYLLLHRNHPVPRGQLAFTLWPNSSEKQARTNLRNALHSLRAALPASDEYLLIDSNVIQWAPRSHFSLDVDCFEKLLQQATLQAEEGDMTGFQVSLEMALRTYSEDLLPNFYMDWIIAERERLRQLFQSALERLIDHYEHQGAYFQAISLVQRLLQCDPLQETTHRLLMRLQALNGNRAGVLNAYQQCASILMQELSVEPSALTQAMLSDLLASNALSQKVSLAKTESTCPLIGREAVWSQILTTFHSARIGHPHFILLKGEIGMGKTRLLMDLLDWSRHQAVHAFYAHCDASDQELPFALLIGWLNSNSFSTLDEASLAETAYPNPVNPHALADLLQQQPHSFNRWQRRRLFDVLASSALVKDSPLFLLVDDLQWCDAESLEWIQFLMRLNPRSPVFIVGAMRLEHEQHNPVLSNLLLSLGHTAQITQIELDALNYAKTIELAEHLTMQKLSPEQASWLYQETEGNPWFVVEMLYAGWLADRNLKANGALTIKEAVASLPRPILSALEERLHQLSNIAWSLLGLAATIGREFPFPLLQTASKLADVETLTEWIDEMIRWRILREIGPDTYSFAHKQLYQVVYAQMSSARLAYNRQQIARALTSH